MTVGPRTPPGNHRAECLDLPGYSSSSSPNTRRSEESEGLAICLPLHAPHAFSAAENDTSVARVWMAEKELWNVIVQTLHCVYRRDSLGDDLSIIHGIAQKPSPRASNSISSVYSLNLLPLMRSMQEAFERHCCFVSAQ